MAQGSSTHQADTRCSLFLYPATSQPVDDTDLERLRDGLRQIALISSPLQDDAQGFYTGEKFLDYIAYMGCSPTISFEADENDSSFCHIRLHHYPQATLIHSRLQARDPICPLCKKPTKDWQENSGRIQCSQCGVTSASADFNWRKMAGVSTLFIEITDIFPKEAIPQQALLDRLAAIFPANWQYFYSCR
ncbi:MAG TPA: hypothetical protein ENJ11_06500 [Gammaproteobacteria bacterium]|nr:hypothetical protein [Gammaproteobacteria bacterium]